jgi:hypothetical protein
LITLAPFLSDDPGQLPATIWAPAFQVDQHAFLLFYTIDDWHRLFAGQAFINPALCFFPVQP